MSLSNPTSAKVLLAQLDATLTSLGSPATFSCGGFFPLCPNPLISIDNIGIVALPLLASAAKDLLSKIRSAPGSGARAKSNPKSATHELCELDPSAFRMLNASFMDYLNEQVLPTIASGIGLSQISIKATIAKLRIFEAGAASTTASRLCDDSRPKEDGSFGTLVLTLPSEYEGGELIVSHDGKSVSYEHDAVKSLSQTQYVAFYADCTHEVRPVTSGHRMALIFNLVTNSSLVIPTNPAVECRVAALLSAWRASIAHDPIQQTAFVYILEHEYNNANKLSFKALEGQDNALGALLSAAALRAGPGIACYLAMLQLQQEANTRDGVYRDEFKRPSKIVFDASYWQIITAVDAKGVKHKQPFENHLIKDEFIRPLDFMERMEPIESPEGHSGRYDSEMERFFRNAALVLVVDTKASELALADPGDILSLAEELLDPNKERPYSGINIDDDDAPIEKNPRKLLLLLLNKPIRLFLNWDDVARFINASLKCGISAHNLYGFVLRRLKGRSWCRAVKTMADTILRLGDRAGWDLILPDNLFDYVENLLLEDAQKRTTEAWRETLTTALLVAGYRTAVPVARQRIARIAAPHFVALMKRDDLDYDYDVSLSRQSKIYAFLAAEKRDDALQEWSTLLQEGKSERFQTKSAWERIEEQLLLLQRLYSALVERAQMHSPASECPAFGSLLQAVLDTARANLPSEPIKPSKAAQPIDAVLGCNCQYCAQLDAFFKSTKKRATIDVVKYKLGHIRNKARLYVNLSVIGDTQIVLERRAPDMAWYNQQVRTYKDRLGKIQVLEQMKTGAFNAELNKDAAPPAKRAKLK